MLNVYSLGAAGLKAIELPSAARRRDQSIWVDLVDPEDDERAEVEALYRQQLPETEDVEEIEASARCYEDETGLHINSLFLHESEGRYRNLSIGFTMSGARLFTVREREIPPFRLLRMRARRNPDVARDSVDVILSVFEIKIEYLADTLEDVYQGLEKVSGLVLEENDCDLEDAIDELGRYEDINGKIRLCLMDTQRSLVFLLRRGGMKDTQREEARDLLRDIESLIPHNNFLFDKVNFLMDAAQGFISIEQNQTIKMFSVVAVVFLPPTLIASIYGMNFDFMPELSWPWGYPMALVLMVLSAIAPFVYFKRKQWL